MKSTYGPVFLVKGTVHQDIGFFHKVFPLTRYLLYIFKNRRTVNKLYSLIFYNQIFGGSSLYRAAGLYQNSFRKQKKKKSAKFLWSGCYMTSKLQYMLRLSATIYNSTVDQECPLF
jgi:hypothetical protein